MLPKSVLVESWTRQTFKSLQFESTYVCSWFLSHKKTLECSFWNPFHLFPFIWLDSRKTLQKKAKNENLRSTHYCRPLYFRNPIFENLVHHYTTNCCFWESFLSSLIIIWHMLMIFWSWSTFPAFGWLDAKYSKKCWEKVCISVDHHDVFLKKNS